LDEAYVNFGWIKSAQIRVGQFQMPFSLEKITSDLFNNFQERFIGDTMSPDKLRGLMVTGSPTTGLYYALAVANGNGAKNANDVNNQVDGKEGIGRLALNLAEMFGQKKAVYHFGGSYADTTMPAGSAFSGRTEARGITFFTPIAFTGSPIDRKQTGLETALAYGPVKLQGETVTSNYSGRSAGGVEYDKDIKAYYASLVWMITGESYADSYANSVFTRIRPNANFTGHGDGWGAWELGLRLSKWDAGDFRTGPAGTGTIAAAGTTAEADALTVGLKWIPNPNTRILLNYIRTKFDTPVNVAGGTPTSQEKAVTLRAQFDF
jgi:phosphate-selective porin OprO/OprP